MRSDIGTSAAASRPTWPMISGWWTSRPPVSDPYAGQDHLGRRDHEAAARDLTALEMKPELGVEMARHFGARVVANRFVAEDDPGDLGLLGEHAAAMIGEGTPLDRGCRRSTSSRGGRSARSAAPAHLPAAGRSRRRRGSCRRGNRPGSRPTARRPAPARSTSRANHRAEGIVRAARTSWLFRGGGRRPEARSAPARRMRRLRSQGTFRRRTKREPWAELITDREAIERLNPRRCRT